MTQEQKENLMAYICIGAVLLIFNLIYVKKHEMVMEMNGSQFVVAGMMKYVNPNDGTEVWLPLYTRKNK